MQASSSSLESLSSRSGKDSVIFRSHRTPTSSAARLASLSSQIKLITTQAESESTNFATMVAKHRSSCAKFDFQYDIVQFSQRKPFEYSEYLNFRAAPSTFVREAPLLSFNKLQKVLNESYGSAIT
jgi:hypothetical protein